MKQTAGEAAAAASLPADPGTDEAIAAVEEQFTRLFTQVSMSMRDRAARIHPDLQPGGFRLLSAIVRSGPTHAGALAAMLYTDKSVISRQVRMLEDMGFVERRTDPSDRRASFIAATPEAIEKVGEVRAADQAQLYRSLRQWGEADVRRLAELLARLNDAGR
ncbi:MarR family winged helix-turn-helix transcriptional regulator [Leifsonia sp. AG29]|uniref:MarR family winged helix-turn-helix transcriptional regulator n=1 Tax=Leifsonia sp. AG29 TaxID=2598860 RepID=UPI001E54625C|nr:MarR family winged helix-turn-helix transcriptional regulator [Leifsonia sp. AG29]